MEADMQKNQQRLDAATRQLAAEVSKSNIATKRIEQQAQRYLFVFSCLFCVDVNVIHQVA